MNEKTLLNMIEPHIKKHTKDYKLFVIERKGLDKIEYSADIAVIVKKEESEIIMREIAQKCINFLTFKQSITEITENKIIDILIFNTKIKFWEVLDEL